MLTRVEHSYLCCFAEKLLFSDGIKGRGHPFGARFWEPNLHPSCPKRPTRGLGFGVDAPYHHVEVLFEKRIFLRGVYKVLFLMLFRKVDLGSTYDFMIHH